MVVKIIQKIKKIVFSEKGMTLVEMLVAMAIFSLSIGIVSQTFVTAIRLQKRFLAATEILNETAYLMEYVSRAVRMAKKDISNQCGIGQKMNFGKTHAGLGLKFKNYENICQEFYFESDAIMENRNGVVNRLTSPKIVVKAFNLGPEDGWTQDDYIQPRVAFYLEAESVDQRNKNNLKLQTTISQRNPDVKR